MVKMQKFQFITHDNHDAYFNLASEEYLLKHTDGYYFYLWINSPAVIVGVNQNAIQEVNLSFTESNGIKVVRRLTGGGAVYHDGGNLCYTVIAPFDETKDNYRAFTNPVIEYLNSLGVLAEFSGRNDITVNGQKISGNAQTVYKNRIMHHGTILFNTDFSVLSKALNPSKLKIESKGIKSVRARVTNVSEYLKYNMTIAEFKNGLAQRLKKDCDVKEFSADEICKIQKLVDEKYSRYEWNIGNSPKGKNTFTAKFPFGIISINFDTEKGLVKAPKIFGDFFSKRDIAGLETSLDGVRFTKTDVEIAFKDIGEYIAGADAKTVAEKLFLPVDGN